MVEADKNIIISSPGIRQDKIERLLYLIKSRQEAGVEVTVITTEPECVNFGNASELYELIATMRATGISVYTKAEVDERFAVIDHELVWHGGMNLLGNTMEDVIDIEMKES